MYRQVHFCQYKHCNSIAESQRTLQICTRKAPCVVACIRLAAILDLGSMKLLDRYVLHTFFFPWLYCLFGFVFLTTILDLFETLDKFVEAERGVGFILRYYMYYLPTMWVYIAPVTLLLAMLWALYSLTRSNEIIAMRASGISLYRILLPYFLFGLVCTGFTAFVIEYLAPPSWQWIQTAQDDLKNPDRDPSILSSDVKYLDPGSNRSWSIGTLYKDGTMDDVDLTIMTADRELKERVSAESAKLEDGFWIFYNAQTQKYRGGDAPIGDTEFSERRLMTGLTETPDQIYLESKEEEWMSAREMRAYLKTRDSVSSRTEQRMATQIQLMAAQPWICLVVTLMAVPFGTQTARKGVFAGMVYCIGLFFGLYFMTLLFKAFGQGGFVSPIVAGWTPILLFGSLGVYLVYRLK